MFKLINLLLFTLLATVSFKASPATLCVDPADGSCFDTIQDAIDGAFSGDVIVIKAIPDSRGYRENLSITTPGLTLRGDAIAPSANIAGQQCPDVILDNCQTAESPDSCGSTIATIAASDTRIERLLVRHGNIVFQAGSEGSSVGEMCFAGDVSDAVATSEAVDNLTVENNIFQGGSGDSIDLLGDNAVVRHNQILAADDGIEVDGESMLVEFNTIYTCNDGCLDTSGANARIENNVLLGSDDGIDHRGDNPMILNNVVNNSADNNIAISCPAPCTSGTVSGNRVIGNTDDDELISISGAENFLIENNFLSLASENALDFNGGNSIIRGNTITRSGTESGFFESCMLIRGNGGNVIENNQIRLCTFQGIRQETGDNNSYRNNVIDNSGKAGILVANGANTTIDGNTITGVHGEGIANGSLATGTTIINNTLVGNRTDICNNGGIGTISGNTFDSGGAGTSCVVDNL